MSAVVKTVKTKSELKQFIMLPYKLYGDDPLWIPPLISQEKAQFDPEKNPAYRYCDTEFFLALRDGIPVGRVAAIINRRYVNKLDRKC